MQEPLEEACGLCSVCEEEDVRVFLFPCGHWACEGCYTDLACDNCQDPQEGISERERNIRILVSAGKFPISAVDTLYLIGVIDVIRQDRNRLRAHFEAHQTAAPDLLKALKMVRTDFLEFEGCYCGQLLGGTDGGGEPLHVCGWCTTEAAIAKAEAPTPTARPTEPAE